MKSNFLKIIIGLVFLVLFNTCFFLLGGTEHSDSVWASFAFIHVAYLLMLTTPMMAKNKSGMVVIVASLYLRGFFFFITELLLGLIVILSNPEDIVWAVVPQAILLAIFLVLQLSSVILNDSTTESLQKQQNESRSIRLLSMQVKNNLRTVENPELKLCIEKAYDALACSSIESIPETLDSELEIQNAVQLLDAAVNENDSEKIKKEAKHILNAVRNRNGILNMCRNK